MSPIDHYFQVNIWNYYKEQQYLGWDRSRIFLKEYSAGEDPTPPFTMQFFGHDGENPVSEEVTVTLWNQKKQAMAKCRYNVQGVFSPTNEKCSTKWKLLRRKEGGLFIKPEEDPSFCLAIDQKEIVLQKCNEKSESMAFLYGTPEMRKRDMLARGLLKRYAHIPEKYNMLKEALKTGEHLYPLKKADSSPYDKILQKELLKPSPPSASSIPSSLAAPSSPSVPNESSSNKPPNTSYSPPSNTSPNASSGTQQLIEYTPKRPVVDTRIDVQISKQYLRSAPDKHENDSMHSDVPSDPYSEKDIIDRMHKKKSSELENVLDEKASKWIYMPAKEKKSSSDACIRGKRKKMFKTYEEYSDDDSLRSTLKKIYIKSKKSNSNIRFGFPSDIHSTHAHGSSFPLYRRNLPSSNNDESDERSYKPRHGYHKAFSAIESFLSK
ncbi:hypothetical protein NEFER03_2035 [Nematocida sp. LUAm3]|nr:hypothetical protein NEFER03_2035 [Nematocida sp. LUAm3]KAI5174509.1 hypothetical protein NEFER02_0630 [Nematocida sp. LUAm2]KAI5179160.1 hypothetical protein NEFER01_2023 [Nematocida sp. LUAm1]